MTLAHTGGGDSSRDEKPERPRGASKAHGFDNLCPSFLQEGQQRATGKTAPGQRN